MSYILPVQNFQYQDYHQRMRSAQKDKHHIERLFKVQLDRRHQEISATHDRYYFNREEPKAPMELPLDSSLITGKGRYFNWYV